MGVQYNEVSIKHHYSRLSSSRGADMWVKKHDIAMTHTKYAKNSKVKINAKTPSRC